MVIGSWKNQKPKEHETKESINCLKVFNPKKLFIPDPAAGNKKYFKGSKTLYLCLVKVRGNCTINFKSQIKEYMARSTVVHPKIIKEPIIQEVEKYITVKPKDKYNKKDRLRAELQGIVLNLMENENHRANVIKLSEDLQTRLRIRHLADSTRTSPDRVMSYKDKIVDNIRNPKPLTFRTSTDIETIMKSQKVKQNKELRNEERRQFNISYIDKW